MAKGFAGFLDAFATTGAEIVKEQDKRQAAQELFIAERVAAAQIDAQIKKTQDSAIMEAQQNAVRGGGTPSAPSSMQPIDPQAYSPAPAGGFNVAVAGNESSYGKNLQNPTSSASGTHGALDSTAADPGFGVRPAADGSMQERSRVGSDYADAMLQKYKGNPVLASLAHFRGPGFVDKWLASGADPAKLDPEARQYVGDVTLRMATGNAAATPANNVPPAPGVVPVDAPITSEDRVAALTELQNKLGKDVMPTSAQLDAEVMKKRTEESRKANEELRKNQEFDLTKQRFDAEQDKAKREKMDSSPQGKIASENLEAAIKTKQNLQFTLSKLDQYEEASKGRYTAKMPTLGILESEAANLLGEAEKDSVIKDAKELRPLSNDEGKMLAKAGISANNWHSVNLSRINALRANVIRQSQLADFWEEAEARGWSKAEAMSRFQDFAEDNRIMKTDEKGRIVLLKPLDELAKDEEFYNYLDPEYKPAKANPTGKKTEATAAKELSPTAKALQDQFPSLRK